MNKKTTTIRLITITAIIVSIVIVLFIYKLANNNDVVQNSGMSKDGYYVDTGSEEIVKLAKIAKPAIENYANQDRNESVDSRSARLGKYFTADSQVYGYEQLNINSVVKKSISNLTSVMPCDDAAADVACIIVMTNTKLYYNDDKTNSKIQKFWVLLKKTDDGSYKTSDIGEWQ